MFVDPIVICSESSEQVDNNLDRCRHALKRGEMKVIRHKTGITVQLQGVEVVKVDKIKYLGSTIQRTVHPLPNLSCALTTALGGDPRYLILSTFITCMHSVLLLLTFFPD